MAAFLNALVNLIVSFITLGLLVYVLMSYLPLEPWHPARRLIERLFEPIVRPFRRLLPPTGGFDFSPLVAWLAVNLAGMLLKAMIAAIWAR